MKKGVSVAQRDVRYLQALKAPHRYLYRYWVPYLYVSILVPVDLDDPADTVQTEPVQEACRVPHAGMVVRMDGYREDGKLARRKHTPPTSYLRATGI